MTEPTLSIDPAGLLRVSGELTIFTAAELKPRLLEGIASGNATLDLSGVSELDTAGLQLLVLASREARSAGKEFRLVSPSPPVQALLELLCLDDRLSERA